MTGITATIVGSLIIAAVSTLGDFVWVTWLPEHRAAYGLIHGTLLFCAIGLFLGVLAARPAVGAAGGALIGALAAGAFYLLAPLVGYSAMFVACCTPGSAGATPAPPPHSIGARCWFAARSPRLRRDSPST